MFLFTGGGIKGRKRNKNPCWGFIPFSPLRIKVLIITIFNITYYFMLSNISYNYRTCILLLQLFIGLIVDVKFLVALYPKLTKK